MSVKFSEPRTSVLVLEFSPFEKLMSVNGTDRSSITPFFNQAMEGVGIAMASHKRVTLLPTIRTLSLG